MGVPTDPKSGLLSVAEFVQQGGLAEVGPKEMVGAPEEVEGGLSHEGPLDLAESGFQLAVETSDLVPYPGGAGTGRGRRAVGVEVEGFHGGHSITRLTGRPPAQC